MQRGLNERDRANEGWTGYCVGCLWEENSDELSPDRGIQGLIGFRAGTLTGLGTSSDLDLCRAMNLYGTRSLIGFELWELSTDDSSLDWDYLQMNSHREAGLSFLRARNSFQSSELYGSWNFTELGTLLLRDCQMNFHWDSGSPLYGLDL